MKPFFLLMMLCAWAITGEAQTSAVHPATATDILTGDSLLSAADAQFPRFLRDQTGQSVLTWIERTDSGITLVCQPFGSDNQPFGTSLRIALPPATAAHGEDIPKLAFKADGTMMVVFNLPKPTPDNIRAGELLYRLSNDGGRSWTPDRPVHRDVRPGKSHSYADLTRLPNGEIGIVWLDDKLPGHEGRTVRFAQTLPGGGFGPEQIVDDNACQCCRTGILTDSRGRIYLTYRDWLPGGIRDVSYVVSADAGQSFSKPALLNSDNWVINACPHAGPQLYAQGETVYAAWYSGEKTRPGVRLTRLNGSQTLMDFIEGPQTKHPQVTGWPDGRLALAWENLVGEGEEAYRQIWLRTYPPTGPVRTVALTPEGQVASDPALLPTPDGLLAAWQVWEGPTPRLIVKHFLFF